MGDGPTAVPVCAAPCLRAGLLDWEHFGPAELARPASTISGCSYWHNFRKGGFDASPPRPCSVSLDCSAPEIVALNALLDDPFFKVDTGGGSEDFGLDPQVAEGLSIKIGETAVGFWAGPACGDEQLCREVPPILEALINQLQAIDAIALADAACAAYAGSAGE